MSRLSLLNSMPAVWESVLQQTTFGRWPGMRRLIPWIAAVIAVGIFVTDWKLSNGGLTPLLYVVPTVIALGSRRQEPLVAVTLLGVVLTMMGYFVGQSSVPSADDLLQRGCSIVALGLVSWLGWQLVESAGAAEQMRVDSCLREMAEEAATFFRSMVDHVPIGISRTDLSGKFVFVNEAFCQMVETPADDLLGRSTSEAIPKEFANPTPGADLEVASSRRSAEQIERVTIGNREHFMKVIRTPVEDAQGRVVGIQAMWLDVTELKSAQHVLERHTTNLERTNEDLKQFAYVASHDLQEPLRTVGSYCQLLQKHYSSQFDERGLQWLDFVLNGARRMQTLVRDLLTYASVDNKADGKSWITVDCFDACQEAIGNLSAAIHDAQARISVSKLPRVWANATQVTLLFQNLIGNAIKFRSDRPLVINVCAEQVGDNWQFTVTDNGIGIKPEFHERVFEIFKRVHSHDQSTGSGIGLAICKRIVERFGGRIWVESKPGRGSIFFFTLPNL